MSKVIGSIKKNSVKTSTSVDELDGTIERVTRITVELRDLDLETIDALAIGAYALRPIQFELIPLQ